jgi:ribosomal protein L37AE/L43A
MIVGLCSRCGRRNIGSVADGVFVCIACTGPQGGPGEPDAKPQPKVEAVQTRRAA